MDFQKFVEYCFYGVASGAAFYGISVLAHLKKSIDSLNERVAVLLEKGNWYERELEKLDERISALEKE